MTNIYSPKLKVINPASRNFFVCPLMMIICILMYASTMVFAQGNIDFIDGYQGDVNTSQDNMIHAGAVTVNFGTHNVYDVSTLRRFIQRFDLSSIPAGSTCNSARLYYYKASQVPNNPVTCTIYSISSANASWMPGTTYGGTANRGESTWNALAADGSGGILTAWAGSAGLSTPGIDYEINSLGSFVIPSNAPIGEEYIAAIRTSRVAEWFGNNNTNYGTLMICDGQAEYIGSSEHENPGYRPKLIVNYSSDIQPPPYIEPPENLRRID